MIYEMEKKLNPSWFSFHNRSKDQYAGISTAQYWDWLTYIDVCNNLTDAKMTCKGKNMKVV